MTRARVAVQLTAPQRSMVAWAADAMADYWADHEGRGEPQETNVADPVLMTATGCEVVCRADVLDDLRYRLTEQLPDMEGNVTAGKGGFHAQCAAARRAYNEIARALGDTIMTARGPRA